MVSWKECVRIPTKCNGSRFHLTWYSTTWTLGKTRMTKVKTLSLCSDAHKKMWILILMKSILSWVMNINTCHSWLSLSSTLPLVKPLWTNHSVICAVSSQLLIKILSDIKIDMLSFLNSKANFRRQKKVKKAFILNKLLKLTYKKKRLSRKSNLVKTKQLEKYSSTNVTTLKAKTMATWWVLSTTGQPKHLSLWCGTPKQWTKLQFSRLLPDQEYLTASTHTL